MLETPARTMHDRLSPVLCGRCGRPVTHMNKRVPGAEAGGMCTHCTKDERTGKPAFYFTYYGVISTCDCQHGKT